MDSSSPPSANVTAAVALQLYQAVVSSLEADANAVLCPLGLIHVLALLQLGARGDTLQQLRQALHPLDIQNEASLHLLQRETAAIISPTKDEVIGSEAFRIAMANGLFLQEGFPFREAFLLQSKGHLGASLMQVDYTQPASAAQAINAWVESQTNGKIRQLFSGEDFGPLSRLALVSAIHFKGSWQQPFPLDSTDLQEFTKPDGTITLVPMMYQTLQAKIGYFSLGGGEVQALELVYGQEGEFSFLVLLPASSDGLPLLERELSLDLLNTWLAQMEVEQVEVYLPRFKVSQTLDLEKALRSLNITHLLETDCDLSGMTEAGQLHISKAVQRTFIEVNEEGSEAAAATGVEAAVIMSLHGHRFKADHPFLFLIRHHLTGALLFAGRVLQPELMETRGRDTQAL